MKTPILGIGKLVKQGYKFEAGPTGCKISKGDRSVTLDVVQNAPWVDAKAYTTTKGARNEDARLVAPVVDGLPEELPSSSGLTTPSFERARAPRGSSLRTCESGCGSYEHQCGAQKNTNVAPCT